MEEVGAALAEQRVASVCLIHGRLGGGGDYSEPYARRFEASLHRPGRPWAPVRLFHWSGESHHLGRADGAVRLIEELAAMDLQPGQRVLLWAHDDAGNLLALAARLLAADREETERFFQAAEVYYRWPVVGCVDVPVWYGVRERLRQGPVLEGVFLDMVTFGAQPRYAWEHAARVRGLHFLDERCADAPCRDASPARSAWRSRMADRRLGRLLAPRRADETPPRGTVFDEPGITLLVDYGDRDAAAGENPAPSVYARQEWLLFHAEEVARRFYSARVVRAA